MDYENKSFLISTSVILSFVLLVLLVLLGLSRILSGAEKRDEAFRNKQNQNVIDCASRNNPLDWCLQNFNK